MEYFLSLSENCKQTRIQGFWPFFCTVLCAQYFTISHRILLRFPSMFRLLFFSYILLSSSTRRLFIPPAIFWTSRGHRCRPFSPPERAFIFIAHRVQHSHCSSIFIECCQLTLSRFPLINYARKSPDEYVHSVTIEVTKLILVCTRITCQVTKDAG